MDFRMKVPLLVTFSTAILCYTYTPLSMKCSYGDRGSLTATCVNATSSYFRITTYRFDHLDETVRCINCNLQTVSSNTFDISGNQIITLDLHNSNISALSQSSFVGLVYMKNLLLSNNQIKSIVPGTFKGIKKVVYLNLANNSISMLVRDGFSELSNLTTLHLENNLIRHVDSNAFNGLSSLKKLYLQNNFIKDLKEVFFGLTAIEIINLERNDIQEIKQMEMSLSTLLDLNLANNKLEGLLPDIFLELPSLRTLNLSNNYIVILGNSVFRGLMFLESLDLSNNTITQLQPAAFLRMYNLRDIDLSHNKLNLLHTTPFSALPELRRLNVSHNRILEIKKGGVLPLYNLHTLDISFNQISYIDYKLLLQHAPKLIYVNIEHNLWPCYLIEEMERYFSEDNIQFTVDDKYQNYTIKCNSSSEKPKEYASQIAKLETNLEHPSQESSPNLYVLYSLVFILLALVVVLFYLQYRTLTYLRGNGRADMSDVHLITSSGLENRDGEY